MESATIETNPAAVPIGPRLVAMIEHDGREIPKGYPDREAEATWAAVSALWHPALLALVVDLPKVEGIDFPPVPEPSEVRLIAEGASHRLPADYRQIASDSGSIVLDGEIDRTSIARRVLERIAPGEELGEPADPIVLDFYALGTARWWLRDLTIAMGHADCLDLESLTRETLAGAKSWRAADLTGAASHLRAAFEILTQARERFYPVDGYLIDLSLLDVSLPAGALADSLEARTPITFLGTAQAVEKAAELDPDRMSALRTAITEGWADVVGGTYSESDEPLAPVTSILWQFLMGSEVYRRHLDDRNVETLATRRFALYPHRPQVARRFGFRFAVHLAFDAGRFPIPVESKRLWESPDASHLESLTRPPLSGDRASDGLRLVWRIGRSMKDDHVATMPLVHWPSPVAGWYRDLRRVASYSPVLSRCVTLGDYFHLSDRPWEMFGPKLDEYVMPYLVQAVARHDPFPISRRASHARVRAGLDAMISLDALGRALAPHPVVDDSEIVTPGPRGASDVAFHEIEHALETGSIEESARRIAKELPAVASALARAIAGDTASGREGYLVVNPLGVARRAAVLLPDAAIDLRPEGPLRAAQLTEDGVRAVVDLPPFGFAWVPRETEIGRPSAPFGAVSASERTMKNENLEVEVDLTTGGLRSVRAKGEETPRLGLQLVIAGLVGAEGQAAPSRMASDSFEVDYAGPALVQAVSRGRLLHPADGRVLVRFQQTLRLWTGRPTLEIDIRLDDIDPAWLESLAMADPWGSYLACRWAWPDAMATLRRTSLLAPESTSADRPETPDALDITSRKQRTALLFGGLAHHRRQGDRMLDTLLISGREQARTFALGVALDLEYPFHATTDFLAPAPVVATSTGPPGIGPVGWLVQVESKSVAVVRLEYLDRTGDGKGWGIAVHLVETAGRASRCRLRVFRDPKDARQTDFSGELIIDLPCEGDAVPIDLTPYEMARVEVRLG
ncbi:MAG: glycosyl hydrolase family 38 [Planctomycetota bacterium]|nr:glycosyl hydrolase family 38 [Planctomycetota bacterium]